MLGRCKCEASQLQYGERCGKVLPFKHQVTGFKDDDLIKSLKTFKSGLAGLHGGTRRLPGKEISDWRDELPSCSTSVTLDIPPTQNLGPGRRRFSFLGLETQNQPFVVDQGH